MLDKELIEFVMDELAASDWKIRKACVTVIAKLMENQFDGMDMQTLVSALVPLLNDASFSVVEQTINALTNIRLNVGDQILEEIIRPSQYQIYSPHRHLICSRNSGFDPEPAVDELQFGFIPKEYIGQIDIKNDWKVRCDSVENIYIISQSVRKDEIIAHGSQLISFLGSLYNDENFNICLIALKITGN
jgi:non-SMC mitotic condensation complex subunit 1